MFGAYRLQATRQTRIDLSEAATLARSFSQKLYGSFVLKGSLEMQTEDTKLVLVIDPSLATGVIANVSALLSISIGKYLENYLGPDVSDASGVTHRGIFDRAITVLAAAPRDIANLHTAGAAFDLILVGLTTHAQKAKTYDEYSSTLAATETEKLDYLGIAICGDRKRVAKLTGSLPLLR